MSTAWWAVVNSPSRAHRYAGGCVFSNFTEALLHDFLGGGARLEVAVGEAVNQRVVLAKWRIKRLLVVLLQKIVHYFHWVGR